MDIRLTALDIETIPEESKPPELRDYSDQLRDLYVLHSWTRDVH